MFQLALLAPGMQGLSRGDGTASSGDSGLAMLLEAGADDSGMFSAELHALLLQLSQEQVSRLEVMMRGGMNLPQAASELLADAGVGDGLESFSALLSQSSAERPSLVQLQQTLAAAPGAHTALTNPVPVAGDPFSHSAYSLPASSAALPASTGVVSGQPALSSQLAGSLLDMAVPQQVGSKGWSNAIGERVMWMMQGDQQFARLKLNPPQLGPLEIRISVSQDQSSVAFMAQHAATREALEAALPRLREMFDQASLQLVRADVGDPAAGREGSAGASDGHSGPAHFAGLGDDSEVEDLSTPAGLINATQLVDLFA